MCLPSTDLLYFVTHSYAFSFRALFGFTVALSLLALQYRLSDDVSMGFSAIWFKEEFLDRD